MTCPDCFSKYDGNSLECLACGCRDKCIRARIKARSHVNHNMRMTSLDAYLQVPQLSETQQQVYDNILENNTMNLYPTDREIAKELGYSDPNKVRPRRYELMEAGIITEAGKRKCSVSKRTALTWKVVKA